MKLAKRWALVVPLVLGSGAWAGKIQLPAIPGLEDASLNVNVQLQAWLQSTENASPQNGINSQVFMRRIRLITSGDITKQLHFFVQLDSPNFGRQAGNDPTGLTGGTGVPNGRVLLQDAQLQYEPVPGAFFEMGLLLLPLSHQQVQSTTSFVTLDLHANTIRFPGATAGVSATSPLNGATTGLRELGVQTRGWAFEKKLGWRLGVYNGVRGAKPAPGRGYDPNDPTSIVGVNPAGAPQFGGYLHFNFLDPEERGWLYQGVYFNNKPILSVGAGFGYQRKAIRGMTPLLGPQDWRAFSGDIYAALPVFPDHELIAQVDYYNYDFGAGNPNTGNGFFAELGYRFGTIQPFVSYEYFSGSETAQPGQTPSTATNADARIIWAGVNYWFRRINSIKLEFEVTRTGSLVASNTVIRSATLQWQLFF